MGDFQTMCLPLIGSKEIIDHKKAIKEPFATAAVELIGNHSKIRPVCTVKLFVTKHWKKQQH